MQTASIQLEELIVVGVCKSERGAQLSLVIINKVLKIMRCPNEIG